MKNLKPKIKKIQKQLGTEKMDGWLLCGFKNQNSIPNKIFSISPSTRKFFIFIPKTGKSQILSSKIEEDLFSDLPLKKQKFLTRKEMIDKLSQLIPKKGKIAIETSSFCNLPNISLVDHGTVQLIKKISKATLVSSANLVQQITSSWDKENLKNHLGAAKLLNQIKNESFDLIFKRIRVEKSITEQEVQSFILSKFKQSNLITDHPPMVASGHNTVNPHFITETSPSKQIKVNELVLIDLWAKLKNKKAIFADITWVAFTGTNIPPEIQKTWKVVKRARDKTVSFIEESWEKGKAIKGFEVDDTCRQIIEENQFGRFFIHRTGHSLDSESHGKGVNLDNFESHDERKLLPGIGFTIEPGIYLRNFGIRSEINMFIDPKKGPTITTSVQKEVLTI